MKRIRGVTMLELLVMGIVAMLVLAMGYEGLVSLKTGFERSVDTNGSSGDARQAMILLSDHLRNAVRCTATSGCVKDSAIDSGTDTSVTYYANQAGSTVTYSLSGGNLVRTENGVNTIVVRRVTSLTLAYYTATGYNATGWSPTAASSPTSAELKSLVGIRVGITSQQNGTSSTVETLIRLRNSPKRGPLVGY